MNQHVAIRAANQVRLHFTNDEFRRMAELGAFEAMNAELVNGEIVKMAPAGPGHSVSNASVLVRIASALSTSDGRLAVDLMVDIEEGTVRAPDVVLLRERWSGARRVSGRDIDLAVEVSDTTLGVDLGDKPNDYARAGVPVYWVIDLKIRSVHVFHNAIEGVYQERALIAFDQPLAIPGAGRTITLA